jgi:hypothetical protein
MFSVFENRQGKRILRASVINEQDEEIAGFSTVPFQKRTFLMGTGPGQKEWQELTKEQPISRKTPFCHEQTNRTFYYSESETGVFSSFIKESALKVRAILLWEENQNRPFWAILTNDNKESQDVIREYMKQWPYFGETLEEGSVLALRAEAEKGCDLAFQQASDSIFADFIGGLHRYCQKHFFSHAMSKLDINYLITNIYSCPGSFLEAEDSFTVILDVPQKAISSKDLKYAVQRVNQRCILDPFGRRLWLEA